MDAQSVIFQICTDFHYIGSVTFNDVLTAEKKFMELLKDYWYNQHFLTYRWWFLVILSIVPAIVWWVIVDKKKIIEITAFGLFYGVAAIILDSIGSNALVWVYPIRLTPYLNPQLYPYDIGVVIIPFMLVYQRWSQPFMKFFFSTGMLSFFLSFISEPFMEWLGIYKAITWKHTYSFIIYWLLALFCWWIIQQFKKLEKKHKMPGS